MGRGMSRREGSFVDRCCMCRFLAIFLIPSMLQACLLALNKLFDNFI